MASQFVRLTLRFLQLFTVTTHSSFFNFSYRFLLRLLPTCQIYLLILSLLFIQTRLHTLHKACLRVAFKLFLLVVLFLQLFFLLFVKVFLEFFFEENRFHWTLSHCFLIRISQIIYGAIFLLETGRKQFRISLLRLYALPNFVCDILDLILNSALQRGTILCLDFP